MSDGTTATQVSPIVEEAEMSHVRNVFDRAANAIVQASELAKQVQSLTEQMEMLRKDIEYVRQRNVELDNLLNDVRQARDHAQSEVSRLNTTLSELDASNRTLAQQFADQTYKVDTLQQTLDRVSKERDDAQLDNIILRDDLEKVKAKLDAIMGFARDLVAQDTPPPAAPTPAEPSPSTDQWQPQPVATQTF